MLTYRLSDRQSKELLVRGAVLEIAIPCLDLDCDPLEYAQERIPAHSALIKSAELADITVYRCRGETESFGSLMGQIATEGNTPSNSSIEYVAVVVIATIQYVGKSRSKLALAWPGKAFRDGSEI